MTTSNPPAGRLSKLVQHVNQPGYWRIAFYTAAAYILYLATVARDYPIPHSSIDKVNHLAAFMVLTLLLILAYPRLRAVHVWLSLLAFGIAIECIQYFIPYRDFSWLDVLADGVGILLGLLSMQQWRHYRVIKNR